MFERKKENKENGKESKSHIKHRNNMCVPWALEAALGCTLAGVSVRGLVWASEEETATVWAVAMVAAWAAAWAAVSAPTSVDL